MNEPTPTRPEEPQEPDREVTNNKPVISERPLTPESAACLRLAQVVLAKQGEDIMQVDDTELNSDSDRFVARLNLSETFEQQPEVGEVLGKFVMLRAVDRATNDQVVPVTITMYSPAETSASNMPERMLADIEVLIGSLDDDSAVEIMIKFKSITTINGQVVVLGVFCLDLPYIGELPEDNQHNQQIIENYQRLRKLYLHILQRFGLLETLDDEVLQFDAEKRSTKRYRDEVDQAKIDFTKLTVAIEDVVNHSSKKRE